MNCEAWKQVKHEGHWHKLVASAAPCAHAGPEQRCTLCQRDAILRSDGVGHRMRIGITRPAAIRTLPLEPPRMTNERAKREALFRIKDPTVLRSPVPIHRPRAQNSK